MTRKNTIVDIIKYHVKGKTIFPAAPAPSETVI
jgi:hypothetical protein